MQNFLKNFSAVDLWARLKLKRRGIAALAALHFYGNPSVKLKIIGVTGTNGKTTTATLLYKIATELGYKTGLISTVENIIGTEIRLATQTTPGPIPLNKLLKEMVDAGCVYVFMEVSSHAMDQNRVAGINFVGGIFTNLTHDHLDYHKSFENYFLAKKKFFEILSPRAFALSNADDEHGVMMLQKIKATAFLYGFENKAEFEGKIEKLDFNGLEMKFNDISVRSHLLGKFNAYNLLAVWSASSLLGFDMQKVNKILENIEPPRGRFDHFMSSDRVLVIVDYAHTPDALEKVLLTIKEITSPQSVSGVKLGAPERRVGRIISVFGCGGDRDPLKRRIMGKIGASLSDIAIFTSDNPRSEDPEKIIAEMKTDLSMADSKKVIIILNRHEAILEAVKLAQKDDIILVAGKGHEDYQEIKGHKYNFNDMEELKRALK